TRIASEEELWEVLRAQAPQCVPAAALDADDVRLEARRRILAAYPDWKQQNMTARGVELIRVGETNWSPEEQAEADTLQAAWDWIKAVRAASNAMESEPPADYADDAHWPGSLS